MAYSYTYFKLNKGFNTYYKFDILLMLTGAGPAIANC